MASPRSLTESVLSRAFELGCDLAGVCSSSPPVSLGAYEEWIGKGMHGSMGYLARSIPLRESPASLLPGVKTIVATGHNYFQHSVERPGFPKIARYALGRDYHKVLRKRLKPLAALISDLCPGSSSRICVDSAPILEREYANRAGLGWFGKNTCIINSQRGSWFFIGLILTTATLAPTEPAIGGCGTCRACIDACPTGAIVFESERWQVDSRKCVSALTIEHRGPFSDSQVPMIGEWTFGCDICQEVCPFNSHRESQPLRGRETTTQDFLQHRDWPSLVHIETLAQEEWDAISAGSPVRRAGLEGFKRNARANRVNQGRV